MARAGTCQDCGARYKIPDTVKATRAKCKKCGGIVEIPAAGTLDEADAPKAAAAAVAAKAVAPSPRRAASAPSKSAPAKTPRKSAKAPSRRGSTSRRGASEAADGDEGGDDAPARKGARRAGGARKGGRKAGAGKASSRRGSSDKGDKKSPLMPVLIIVGVLAAGGGAWYFMGGDGETPAGDGDTAKPAGGETSEDTSASGEGSAAGDNTSATPDEVVESNPPADEVPDPTSTDSASASGDDSAEKAPAPAPVVAAVEALDPVLTFDLFPPLEGTDQAEFDEWVATIHEYYLDPPGPRGQRKLRDKIDAMDIVDATPAFLNVMHGLDLSNSTSIRDSFRLVSDWQERQGGKLHFFFDGDITLTEPKDVNKRVLATLGWVKWWDQKRIDPAAVEKYRADVAAKLAQQEDA